MSRSKHSGGHWVDKPGSSKSKSGVPIEGKYQKNTKAGMTTGGKKGRKAYLDSL